MKNNPKNVSTPIIVILYLLAILFLGYGIYMAYDAVIYVNTYDTNDAVSASNMLQYVVAASASYFGFAIVIFAAASIILSLNKVQKNLCSVLSAEYMQDSYPDEFPDDGFIEEGFAEKDLPDDNEKSEAAPVHPLPPAESMEAPEVPDTPEIHEDHEAGATVEDPEISDVPVMPEAANVMETAGDTDTEERIEASEHIETVEEIESIDRTVLTPEPLASEKEQETGSEISEAIHDTSIPLAEEFSSQFLSNTDRAPATEILAHQQPTPEIVIQGKPAPEVALQQPSPPEIAEQQKPSVEAPVVKPAEKQQPSTVPEEILQTKRKRGLKYETVSMDMGKPAPEHTQNLSDTIRLKKGDRESISSSFIKDILEKNE